MTIYWLFVIHGLETTSVQSAMKKFTGLAVLLCVSAWRMTVLLGWLRSPPHCSLVSQYLACSWFPLQRRASKPPSLRPQSTGSAGCLSQLVFLQPADQRIQPQLPVSPGFGWQFSGLQWRGSSEMLVGLQLQRTVLHRPAVHPHWSERNENRQRQSNFKELRCPIVSL